MTELRTLFVGIGSSHGDDQIGWLVADRLQEVARQAVAIHKAATPADLLGWMDDYDQLVICDAYVDQTASVPARLRRWNWPTQELDSLRSTSSHSFGLRRVLELAAELSHLPEQTIIYGIQGQTFRAMSGISHSLDESLMEVVSEIARDLEQLVQSKIEEGDPLKEADHA